MTEPQGTAGGKVRGQTEDPQWRVEGSKEAPAAWDEAMSDTVVRIPKIPANGKDAASAKAASAQTPVTGRTRPVPAKTRQTSAKSAPVTPEPSKPAPVKPALVKPAASGQPSRPAASRPSMKASGGAAAATGAAAANAALPPMARPMSAAGQPQVVAASGPAGAAKPSVRRTRKARLRLSRVDPWSVMKTSFLFSIAFGIMFWVSIYVLWTVVTASGLFDVINSQVISILSSPNNTESWRIEDYINTNKVLGIAALFAVINVVLITALGTITAFLYNLSANILGGLELTLAED